MTASGPGQPRELAPSSRAANRNYAGMPTTRAARARRRTRRKLPSTISARPPRSGVHAPGSRRRSPPARARCWRGVQPTRCCARWRATRRFRARYLCAGSSGLPPRATRGRAIGRRHPHLRLERLLQPRGIELLTARAAGVPPERACHELALHAGGTTCQSQKTALFQEAAALGHFVRLTRQPAHRRRVMREKLDSLGLEGTTLDHWDALIAPEVRAAWDQVDLLNEQDGTRQDLVLQGRAYACCNPAGCSRWRIRRTRGKKQPWKAVNAELFGQPTGVTWNDVGPGPAPNLRTCRECDAAAYCSTFCQMTHWLGSSHSGGTNGPHSHKPECLRLRALRAGV